MDYCTGGVIDIWPFKVIGIGSYGSQWISHPLFRFLPITITREPIAALTEGDSVVVVFCDLAETEVGPALEEISTMLDMAGMIGIGCFARAASTDPIAIYPGFHAWIGLDEAQACDAVPLPIRLFYELFRMSMEEEFVCVDFSDLRLALHRAGRLYIAHGNATSTRAAGSGGQDPITNATVQALHHVKQSGIKIDSAKTILLRILGDTSTSMDHFAAASAYLENNTNDSSLLISTIRIDPNQAGGNAEALLMIALGQGES